MSRPIISSQAPYGLRYPRTQREAGIDVQEWENRLSAMRPWAYDLATGICLVMFAGAAFYAAQHVSQLFQALGL